MFAAEYPTLDAMVPLLTGAITTLCGFRVFSKKPEVTAWKRGVFASYWVIGPALIALGVYMLVTGQTIR